MKSLLPAILILSGICAQSCIDCGPQAELTARINFSGDSIRLDSIYAQDARDQRPMNAHLPKTKVSYLELDLPISLHSDTTTYIFRFPNRIDTLSIHYRRTFSYKGGCGFINDATEPSQGSHYESTFRSVDIIYAPYVRTGKVSWTDPVPGGGILIRITP